MNGWLNTRKQNYIDGCEFLDKQKKKKKHRRFSHHTGNKVFSFNAVYLAVYESVIKNAGQP